MLKKYVRRWFGVTNAEEAQRVKRRVSMIYALVGWNIFGVVLYQMFRNTEILNPTERRMSYSKLTGASQNLRVYQVKGFTVTDEFEIAYKDKIKEEQIKSNKQNS